MCAKIKKAFTLIELVVVIAVIAVLSAVSVVTYLGVTESANVSNAESYSKQIKDAYIMYRIENPINPDDDSLSGYNAKTFYETDIREFIINYLPSQGCDSTHLNFKVIYTNDRQYLPLLFVDYGKAYCFYIDGNDISENSTLYKNQEELFKNLVNDEITTIFDSNYLNIDSDDLLLKIENGKFKNEKVKIKADNKTFYVDPNKTIYDATDSSFNSILDKVPETRPIETEEGIINPIFENNGVTYKPDTPITIPEGLTSEVENLGNQKYDVYTINTSFNVKYENNKEFSDYSLDNYEAYSDNMITEKSDIPHHVFGDFKYLVNLANKNSESTNIYVSNVQVSENITLNENIKLYLGWNYLDVEKGFKATLEAKTNSSWKQSTLTVNENTQLEINGVIYLASQLQPNDQVSSTDMVSKGNVLVTSKVNLKENSKLILNNGYLYAYGKVVGDGEIETKGNSFIRNVLKIHDWLGGSLAKQLSFADVFPFSKYSILNIEVETKLNSESMYELEGSIKVSYFKGTMAIPLISPTDFSLNPKKYIEKPESTTAKEKIEKPLFTLEKGTIILSKESADKNLANNDVLINNKLSDEYGDRFVITVKDGILHDNLIPEFKLDVIISTALILDFKQGFPLYNLGINSNNSSITLTHTSFKLLPGSYINLENNSSLNIDGENALIAYKTYDYTKIIKNNDNKVNWCAKRNISKDVEGAYIDIKDTSSVNVSEKSCLVANFKTIEKLPENIDLNKDLLPWEMINSEYINVATTDEFDKKINVEVDDSLNFQVGKDLEHSECSGYNLSSKIIQ